MYNSALEKEMAELGDQSMPYLKDLWESYFDESAPLFNKATLVNKLAYRMQELEFGGLSTETLNMLRDLIKGRKIKRRVKAFRPVSGTRLMREHGGIEHYVTVLSKGFEYQDQHYKSLSAIATLITGTRWSGNAFFGLTSRKGRIL